MCVSVKVCLKCKKYVLNRVIKRALCVFSYCWLLLRRDRLFILKFLRNFLSAIIFLKDYLYKAYFES